MEKQNLFSDFIALRRLERALEQALLLVDDNALQSKLQAQLEALKIEILRIKLNALTKQEKKAC
jgi:hypothetical protein